MRRAQIVTAMLAAVLSTGGVGRWARVEAHVAPPLNVSPIAAASPVTDSLAVDVAQSVMRWKGTKFRGRGKHEGTVNLSGGALLLCGARPCGGNFTIDMRTIEITAIPLHDPVPRGRLARHLASRDFFWVERHPSAIFRLREVRRVRGTRHQVTGDLTLRGVTASLAFPAVLEQHADSAARIRARFVIDRQRWGVEYRFDPVRNEIIDDDIHLDLVLALRRMRAVASGNRTP